MVAESDSDVPAMSLQPVVAIVVVVVVKLIQFVVLILRSCPVSVQSVGTGTVMVFDKLFVLMPASKTPSTLKLDGRSPVNG